MLNGGYPSSPVTYSVTKVNDKLQSIDKPIEITGDKKSHAELNDVKAGKYLIEQKIIPEGYIKDTRQIVNITREESGYALFEIDKEQIEEFERTKVTINKEIVNEKGETATEQDFKDANINIKDKYSFEIKIQNVDTKEIYYSFIDDKNTDTIVGLPYGTYEIEEVYKPKFKLLELQGERLTKDEETGKVTFTLSEDNVEIENTIVINVKNQIDTGFGFGGQDSKDNLSKVLVEDVDELIVTKSKIYVRDDENNNVSDATFKLYDSNGNIVKLTGSDGIYFESDEGNEVISPVNGSIILRALPQGEYKLVNESVNENFLKSSDRTVTVYESAVGVTRIELLRNIPRGSIRLSTVYTDELGEEHYTPRSKYKVFNPKTNEVLTFIKKADGTYERSNLSNATEKISLKAGYIDVNGIEAGIEYQIGLVDVTEKYGIIKEEPEEVTIKEGTLQEVKVSVKDRTGMFTKVLTPGSGSLTVALDKEGRIWMCDNANYNTLGLKNNYQLQCINDIEMYSSIKDVKFKDIINVGDNSFVAIDIEGKIWTWGEKTGILGDGTTSGRRNPICISNIEGNSLHDNNISIKKVTGNNDYSSSYVFALDEKGKVWYWGRFAGQSSGDEWLADSRTPICMSDISDLQNVIITDIICNSLYTVLAVDNQGKVWTWGINSRSEAGLPNSEFYVKPTCISNLEGSSIKDVKVIKVANAEHTSFLIDTENRLWAFGSSDYGLIGNGVEITGETDSSNPQYQNPICLNNNNPNNPLNGIGIIDIKAEYRTVTAIDELGRLWAWGSDNNSGILGTGKQYTNDNGAGFAIYPICISELENNYLETVELETVSAAYYNNAAAIDREGKIWTWGRSYALPTGGYGNEVQSPTKLEIATSSHFDIPKFVKVSAGQEHSVAIDEEGKLWSWGSDNNLLLGTGYKNYSERTSTSVPVCVGGYNNAISKVKIVDVAAGINHNIALDSDGNLWGWGMLGSAYLGFGSEELGNSSGYQADPICITNLNIEDNVLKDKKISKISTMYQHSAVIDTDGKLYTFGNNSNGELGNGTVGSNIQTNRITCLNDKLAGDLTDVKFVDVSTGMNYTIALDSEGKVWTFGNGDYGKLGFTASIVPNPVCISNFSGYSLDGVKIKQISAGTSHSIAVDEEGKIWIWGNNRNKQLGYGTTTEIVQPICISNIATNKLYGRKIEKVIAGNDMSIAIDEEGKIWTWGSNHTGQLGQDTTKDTGEIECINNRVDLISKEISAGYGNFCLALDNKGNLWSWGSSSSGKSGRENEDVAKPLKLEGETIILNENYNKLYNNIIEGDSDAVGILNTAIIPTDYPTDYSEIASKIEYQGSTIILDKKGNLWSSGTNSEFGILGDGTTNPIYVPKKMNYMFEGKNIQSLIFCGTLVMVIDEERDLWIWGDNHSGSCGTGNLDTVLIPICISKEYNFKIKQLNSAGFTMAVLDDNDKIWTWGDNSQGQCGTGNRDNVLVPTRINEITVNKSISSYGPTVVEDTDGVIWSWGINNYGQCGVNTNDNYVLTPTAINYVQGTGLTFRLDSVVASGSTNIIKDTEGKIWTWGRNNYGQCGTGTNSNVLEPTCINGDNKFVVSEVISKGNTNIMKDTEGKIWTWGQNNYGQCGTGTNSNVLEPTCINGDNKFVVSEVISKGNTNIIKDTEGKIWTWGLNKNGQCGTGTNSNVLTPTCINEDNKFAVSEVILEGNTNIIKDTEGKIWTWGYNNYGQCGTGTNSSVLVPTCINGDNKFAVSEVISKGYTNIIQDTEGRIWTWGQNSNGQCGTGTNSNVLAPTCINGDNKFVVSEVISKGNTNIIKDTEGKIWTWGQNNCGQCGTGGTERYATPKCINSIEGLEDVVFTEISNSGIKVTAVDVNGKIWTWGNNSYGNLGIGREESVVRTPVCKTDYYESIGLEVSKVLLDGNTKILLDTQGKIWTYGQNNYGQCGTGTNSNVLTPTCINEDNDLILGDNDKIIEYSNYVYILKENGEAWVWGNSSILTPIKLNGIEELGGQKIKEIAINSDTNKIDILTEDKILYQVLITADGTTVEYKNGGDEILGTCEGPWKKHFRVIKDAV